MDVSNWWPEHRACSNASGQAAVIEKAKAEALRSVGASSIDQDGRLLPTGSTAGETPPLPFSPPEGQQDQLFDMPTPMRANRRRGVTIQVRAGLTWAEFLADVDSWPWLTEFVDVPDDASPPLYMSPPADDAVGSYGHEVIAWAERERGVRLRWWQRLTIVRQLEHRADGSLTHRKFLMSGPRRAGKSVWLREGSLWRIGPGARLFGEEQLVMHTGSDIAICREVQQKAWRWAEDKAGWTVSRANGKEAVETPEGHRWLVRAQTAVYGYDVTLALVDEGWDVKPETVSDGLEPATLERISPQTVLTSTAHRKARSMMRGQITTALTLAVDGAGIIMWGVPFDLDRERWGDPDVWRAASPHWSEDRRLMIQAKYAEAVEKAETPEVDDPDPVASFAAQYLNLWDLKVSRAARGEEFMDEDTWTALRKPKPATAPRGAAIESWVSQGASLALAWPLGDLVLVSVAGYPTVAEAADALRSSGYRGEVIVGASLTEDPALRGLRVTAGERTGSRAVQDLARLLGERRFVHDGGDHLTSQVLDLRTTRTADGLRVASHTNLAGIKSAVWAAGGARNKPTSTVGFMLPSGA